MIIIIIVMTNVIKIMMIKIIMIRSDPLVRQQVEWSVRQETGYKRRAFLVANRYQRYQHNHHHQHYHYKRRPVLDSNRQFASSSKPSSLSSLS